MIFSNLWGRVTGKDKRKQYPEQQASILGRLSDLVIIYPYGMYCDLPNEVLLYSTAKGKSFPVTVVRPDDTAQGEPVVFHPVTNSRIVFRNNGDIDVYAVGSKVNVECDEVNVLAATVVNVDTVTVNITAANTNINGNLTVTGDTNLSTVVNSNGNNIGDTHQHSQGNDGAGDSQQDINGVN